MNHPTEAEYGHAKMQSWLCTRCPMSYPYSAMVPFCEGDEEEGMHPRVYAPPVQYKGVSLGAVPLAWLGHLPKEGESTP